MDIQGKSCPSAKMFGVHETVLDGEHGYVHKGRVTSTFYPATHWEPVEEWVKIEVPQHQIRKFYYMRDYVTGTFLKWRYPQ